jgi:predicted dehydrogenase
MIGSGRIAQTYLAAWPQVEGAKLVAVCDRVPAVASATAEAHGVTGYDDCRALMAEERPDAVVICTPPAAHRDAAIAALQAGAHVLCEKPIAVSSTDIAAMQRTASITSRVLMMASKFRYVDDIAGARSLIQAGILGKPVFLENAFTGWLDVRDRWNADPEIAGGGVLVDNGTHSVDIARFLLGPIDQVMAHTGPKVQPIEVEDTAHVTFRTRGGATGSILLSWSMHKDSASYLDVYGTEGQLSLGWKASRYRQNHSSSWVEFGNGYDKVAAFTAQLRNFVGTIGGTETPRITDADALASVRVIEAAYRSARERAWIDVAEA